MYGNHSLKHWDEYQSSPCVLTNVLVFRYNNHCCDFESVSGLWNRSPFSTVHFQRNALYSSDYNDLRTQSMKLNTSGSISMYSIGKSLSLFIWTSIDSQCYNVVYKYFWLNSLKLLFSYECIDFHSSISIRCLAWIKYTFDTLLSQWLSCILEHRW